MSKQGKSRKSLIIGIVAAVVVLAGVLALLLTQCTFGNTGETTAPSSTAGEKVAGSYDLYWNIDRALYDGKSEAGMSSRTPEDDGYFHVRFFKDGEIVTLKVAERKTINAMEVQNLMGLELDENGIVTGIIPIDELPCEPVAWQFYVQSVGGNLIKTNSSASLNGMEVLLEITDKIGIWDMTGLSGEVGCDATPIPYDRIMAVANEDGQVTHVFIYSRENYMRTHEAECEHCGKVVQWSEWTKENVAPSTTGHYQLMNDIAITSSQISMAEDQKICLDLNGKRIDGRENSRVYSLHNPSTELAIMDTSEEKTGTIAAHGKGDQGMCVWLRYGVVYLYDGILDASDATSIKNGTAVALQSNTYMYMHGGEIVGGTSTYLKNDAGGYANGLGGTLALANKSKFVMNDGVIRDGFAQAIVTARDKNGEPTTYQRGIGGNIFMSSGSVFEMNGGVIKNGKAGNYGGNIMLDGTAEFTMNGGKIQGGTITGKGKNGGSIYIASKATFTLKSGSITGGSARNCAGNIYTNGKFIMTGGYVGGGRIISWTTGKVVADSANRNVFVVNGTFRMYGGSIDGGVQAIDTDAKKTVTSVGLTTHATIASETAPNLTISSGGSGVVVNVGAMRDKAKIGVSTDVGLFSEVTSKDNLDNFFSDIEGAEVVYYQDRLGLGRVNCLCGEENHLPGCDGELLFWAPWTKTDSLPVTTGNYYLLKNVTCGQQNVAADADVKLDLNGKVVNGKANSRIYSMHYRVEHEAEDGTKTYTYPAHLTITDTSEKHDGKMISHGINSHQGSIAWLRYGDMTIVAGILDASDYKLHGTWSAGDDGLFGTADDKSTAMAGAAISVPYERTFTMYGGTVIGGETVSHDYIKTNTISATEGAEPTTEEVAKTVNAGHGGTVDVSGTMYMYGGTIRDGISGSTAGNVRVNSSGKFYMYNGTISGGTSTGNGGNIQISGLMELRGGKVVDGWSKNTAGNFHISPGKLVMAGGYIGGGKCGANASPATEHANVFCVNGKMDLTGGEIAGHVRIVNYNTQGAEKGSVVNFSGNPVISGAKVNVVLAPQDDKTGKNDDGKVPTMPVVNIVGPMTAGAKVEIYTQTLGVDFAVGEGYTVTDKDAKAFSYTGMDMTAAADTENNSLFFGRFGCLCGKQTHTFGCQQVGEGKQLKWYAWLRVDSLPTTGNFFLAQDVSGSGSTTVKNGTTLNLDLNGKTVTWKYRAYRIYDVDVVSGATLTMTNTAEKSGVIQAVEHSGVDQGCAVWVASGEKGTFNMLDGVVLDGSKYTISNVPSEKNGAGSVAEKNGGVVAIQTDGVFNMYGGKIIGAKAVRSEEITLSNGKKYSAYAPNGAAVAVAAGKANMYGGEIAGGRTANQGGNLFISGEMSMYGGTVSGGHADNSGGNIFINRSGKLYMSGDAKVLDGTATKHSGNILVDNVLTMTDDALVSGGVSEGYSGNILINATKYNDKNYYGSVTMSGNARVENGHALDAYVKDSAGNVTASGAGNITVSGGTSLEMKDNAVVTGGIAEAQTVGDEPTGGNLNVSGTVIIGGNAKVTDGQSYHTAGNIRINSSGNVTIKDNATVSGGKSTNSKADKSKAMSAKQSNANIFCVNGQLNLLGGKVDGNSTVLNSSASNSAKVTLSGAPVIKGGASGTDLGIGYTASGTKCPTVTIVGELTGEADSIGVRLSNMPYSGVLASGDGYTVTEKDAAVFFVNDAATYGTDAYLGEPHGYANSVIVGKLQCICGKPGGTHVEGVCDKENHLWIGISGSNMPTASGYYYLIGNMDIKTGVTASVTNETCKIVVDLNGYNITSSTGRIYTTRNTADVDAKVDIIFTNTYVGERVSGQGRSKITVTGEGHQGRIVWLNGENKSLLAYNLDVDISRATITKSETGVKNGVAFASSWENDTGNNETLDNYISLYDVDFVGGTTHSDGQVLAVGNEGHLLMKDCTITGGNATHMHNGSAQSSGGNGGAIILSGNGEATLIDTVIQNCTATKQAGGVYIDGTAKLIVSGNTKITGNTVDGKTNNVRIAGDARIICQNLGDNASIGVSLSANTGVFGTGSQTDAGKFFQDAPTVGQIYSADDSLYINMVRCLCGTSEHTKACKELWNGEARVWTAWTETSYLPITSGNYYLTAPVTITRSAQGTTSKQQTLAQNANVVLDLNGFAVDGGENYRVYSLYNTGTELTITDTVGTGIIRSHGTGMDQGTIVWAYNGNFNLVAGNLDASDFTLKNDWNTGSNAVSEKNGGAVAVGGVSTFTMYDGTITGATTVKSTKTVNNAVQDIYAPNGGSVAVSGTFIMHNGTIQGGKTANQGGNVLVSGDMFMYGGKITGGHADKNAGNIFVHRNGELHMSGNALVEKGTSDSHSGNINVDGILTMTDNAQVTGGKATTGAGNINANFVTSGGVTYYGNVTIGGKASVTDGESGSNGGNLRVLKGATITIKDEALISGGLGQDGGSIQVSGNMIMDGGKVTGGTATHNGGNIRIDGDGTLTLNSGTIENGWGQNVTGNIHVDSGKLIMNGGKITGGKSKSDGVTTATSRNINSVNGYIELNGGTVDDGIEINYYSGSVAPTTKVSGNAVVNGFVRLTYTDGLAQPLINVDSSFASSLKVYVKSDGIITTGPVTAAQAAKITTTNSGKGVYRLTDKMTTVTEDVGKLYVGQVHCVCGASITGGDHYDDICDGTIHYWTPTDKIIDSDGKGADQYYYLTGNTTVSAQNTLDTAHNVTYDLNGFSVTVESGRMIRTYNSGSNKIGITITNTGAVKPEGNLVVTGGGDQGRLLWLHGSNKIVKVYNVSVNISAANVSNAVAKHGVAFAVEGSSNNLGLYKITAVGGTSKSDGNFLIVGAGDNNTCTIKDSSITNCNTNPTDTELGGKGGAIFVGNKATLTLHNTEITGCKAKVNGGGVYVAGTGKLIISGSTKIHGNTVGGVENNVYLEENATIETGTLGSNAQVGLTGVTGDVLSTDVTYAEMDKYFKADSDSQQLAHMGDGLSLQDGAAHIHCVCAGTQLGKNGHTCKDIVYTAVTSLGDAKDITGNNNWYLDGETVDVKLTSQHWIKDTTNLCLNGHNLVGNTGSRVLSAYDANAKLTITTCDEAYVEGSQTANAIKAVSSSSGSAANGGVVWVSKGVAELYRGTLDASQFILKPEVTDKAATSTEAAKTSIAGKHGAAVHVQSTGNFYMYGGTIIGGKTISISGNYKNGDKAAYREASHGGAIAINAGTNFYMYDGVIRDGTCGWGVSVNGERKNEGWGGNVYLMGNMHIYGGEIRNGAQAKQDGTRDTDWTGANVTIRENGVLNMHGGTITGTVRGMEPLSGTKPAVNVSGSAKIFGGETANNIYAGTVSLKVGSITENAKIGLLILSEEMIGSSVATVESAVTIDPAQFPVRDLELPNSSTRTFAVQQDGTSLKIIETTN